MSLYKSRSFCYTCRKREIMAMTEEEINKVKKFKFPNQSKL